MTIQTNALEMRLGQLLAKAQQLFTDQIVPPSALADDGRAWFDKPEVVAFWSSLERLDAELRRVLRQFDGLQRQRVEMEAKLAAVPHDQRWREHSRIASLEDDLSRLLRPAARLAALLADLRRRGGGVGAVDIAQAIQHIGAETGKSLDQMMVRRTVQQVTARPAYVLPAGARPELGGLIETLFVVIAMVSALARRRGGRSK